MAQAGAVAEARENNSVVERAAQLDGWKQPQRSRSRAKGPQRKAAERTAAIASCHLMLAAEPEPVPEWS